MPIQFKAGKPEHSEFYVSPGDYRLRVIEALEDTSKSGNDLIKLKLRIQLPNGDDGPAFYDYLVFTESSFWKIDHFLKSCGRHPGEGEEVELNVEGMTGWECRATLKVDTFEGQKHNKIAAYLFDDDEF